MRRLLIKLLTTILCGPCNERVEIVMSETSPEIFHKDVRRSAPICNYTDQDLFHLAFGIEIKGWDRVRSA